MCCGQPAKVLDDDQAHDLWVRYLAGESKQLLCVFFRIGTPEYCRALRRGRELGAWSPIPRIPSEAPTAPQEA